MSTVDGASERVLNARQRLLWSMYDFSVGRGLEVGPLHQTAAPREYADVSYVDVFDRAGLQQHYGDDPGVPIDEIPEIDYPLFDGERVRSIPEAIGGRPDFDWVVASHVVEHVPDFIGWLKQIAEVTRDGGDLMLAIPDRRYCFDLHRPGTTVGQMLQSHELGETVPSIRAVFDYTRGHASIRAPKAWAGELVGYENRIHSLDVVLERVERARRGEYVDSHVWTFTPGTFLEAIIELRTLGLCEWRVSSLVPTPRNQLEFYAVLTRLPRDGRWDAELLADEPKPGSMPDWVQADADLRRELDRTREDLAATRDELAAVRARHHSVKKELTSARARLRKTPPSALSRVAAAVRTKPGGDKAVALARRARRRFRG